MSFDELLKRYKAKTCILSVEKIDDKHFGNIRVVAGNKAHCNDIEQITGHPFVPGCPYEMCFPKNPNFEDFCCRAAIGGEPMHSYVSLYQMGLWLNMFLIPLESDEPNTGYCIYTYDVTPQANTEKMSDVSADSSAKVLQTCIKLRGAADFEKAINEVIGDIRAICDSDECNIVYLDHDAMRCRMLGKASRKGIVHTDADWPEEDNYKLAVNWEKALDGSTCLIVKNDEDMELIRRKDPQWYESLKEAKVKSMVFFPLKHGDETLGFMWAINFNTENTVKIKETLELTTFFIGAEIANYALMKRLQTLSSIDMLTGILNRNIMNNRVDRVIAGKDVLETPYAIIFADMNGLKRLNDTEGHSAGDVMLKDAAQLLSDVFYDAEVYRVGGDEFMVIACKMDPKTAKERVAELIERANKTETLRFAVGMSFSADEPDILKAMRNADKRMYEDKKHFYEQHPELIYRQ